ncbi:MAG: RluA family pseudouridine synthase [Desulfuromonadaceae bacterium]|nr:RluA family pseudouridine synthase [Desulfuromonadaceae bacterium]
MPSFQVEKCEDGLALLAFLQRRIPAAGAGYLRQLVKKQRITSAGQPLDGTAVVACGQFIELPQSHRLQELLAAMPLPCPQQTVSVLYESRELIVVDKPAGLAVHASVGHELDHLTGRVQALLRHGGGRYQVSPVHRLDLETSGPVLFGKGRQACGELGRLLMRQEIEKTYLALVRGAPSAAGLLDMPVRAKGKLKAARTHYRVVRSGPAAALLALKLETGRQHQIRRQLAELGHPLFGDRRYGGPCPAEPGRLFLHCCRLSFIDPFSGAPLDIECPLPESLQTFAASHLK